MPSSVRAILFDIGGVLIRTEDPSIRLRLAQRWGLDRAGLDQVVFGSPAAQAVERGEAQESAVWESARQALNLRPEDMDAFQAAFWAGDRLDRSLIHLLGKLHARYRTGLLTNSWLRDPLSMFTSRFQMPREEIRSVLDVVVSSAQIGVQKPDARIFTYACEQLGTAPQETVFVDDFPQNIQAARALGMLGVLFESPTQARRDLMTLLAE
jgi:glucose-1-phosphatase